MEHTGATEDYGQVLADIREQMTAEDAYPGSHVDGESCGTCNIAEALKLSLNTAYYRLMLKLKNGPQAVADAAHQAGVAKSFPGVDHTLSEDGKGGPPNNGIVLGQYQTRPNDMASAYATFASTRNAGRPRTSIGFRFQT